MASIAPHISIARPGASDPARASGTAERPHPRNNRRAFGAWRDLIIGDGPLFIRVLRWGQRHRQQT